MRETITLLKVDEIWASPKASTLTTLLDVVVFFAIIHQLLLRRLLLVRNGLLASLAGAGVVLGALAANRKSETMTDSAIATDIHKTFDVHLDGRTELTFNLVFRVYLGTDLGDLLIVLFSDLHCRFDATLLVDLLG